MSFISKHHINRWSVHGHGVALVMAITLIGIFWYFFYAKPLHALLQERKKYHTQLVNDYHALLKTYATSAAYCKANAVNNKTLSLADMVAELIQSCESCNLEISSYTAHKLKPTSQNDKQKITLNVCGMPDNICSFLKLLESKRYLALDKLTIQMCPDALCNVSLHVALGS